MFGFGRRRAAEPAAVVDDIRRTIARLDAQRRAAAQAAGRALVDQAQVRRACDEQLRTLAAAFGEAQNAETLARRAAKSARRDDDPGLDAIEQTAAGLHDAQAALAAAAEPIHALLASSRDNTAQAQQVLAQAQAVFDGQVRAQLRLLQALERIERERITRDARRR